MFTNMEHIKNVKHDSHNNTYDLDVYEDKATGECCIFISKSEEIISYIFTASGEYRRCISKLGKAIGDTFTASGEIITDAKLATGSNGFDVIEELLSIAKDDIDRNKDGHYAPLQTNQTNNRPN